MARACNGLGAVVHIFEKGLNRREYFGLARQEVPEAIFDEGFEVAGG